MFFIFFVITAILLKTRPLDKKTSELIFESYSDGLLLTIPTDAFEYCKCCDGGNESVSLYPVLKNSSLQELVKVLQL